MIMWYLSTSQKGKKHQRVEASQPMSNELLSISPSRPKKQRLNPDSEAHYDHLVPEQNLMCQSQSMEEPDPINFALQYKHQIPANDKVQLNEVFLADDLMPLPMKASHDDEHTTTSMDVFLKAWATPYSMANDKFSKLTAIANDSTGRIDVSDCEEYAILEDIQHKYDVPNLLQ